VLFVVVVVCCIVVCSLLVYVLFITYVVGNIVCVYYRQHMLCEAINAQERKEMLINIKKECMIDGESVALWPMMQRVLSVCTCEYVL